MAVDLDTVAEGLWQRLRDVLLAERRLAGFAFDPEPTSEALPAPLDGGDAAIGAVARDLALRTLAAAADATNYRLLVLIGEASMGVHDLAAASGLPTLAVRERVAGLVQVGLAARELERDTVRGTPAGRALVALVEEIGGGLAARCRAGRSALA
jgi:hypothetical protein